MKNSEYWAKRFEDLEKSQNRKAEEAYAQIERQYRLAQKELDSQIARWYQRFADNNDISLADAHKWIVGKDLAEFKWDVDDYIKYGKENAINQKWMKQLENASARVHISRLEALKLQTQQSMEKMFGNQLDIVDSAMKDIYASGYYHTAFEVQKGVGVGWNFATLDDNKISKVINNPWAADGRNFSERIWGNREKLVNELNTTLTQNIMLGEDPQKAIDTIAKKMGVSKRNAARLVMTEKAYISSVSQGDAFRELDVEQYQVLATLDSHTSEICRDLDGKIYPMADYRAGDTAPPYHVYCRSTTVPYFDDDFDVPGERAARGEDGKTYYVPANMTYREWEKSFVEGGSKSELTQFLSDGTIEVNSSSNTIASVLQNTIESVLHEKELELSKLIDHEEGVTIDRNTGVVLQHVKGETNSVSPDDSLIKNNIFTHNHSSGNCSFSLNDIRSIINDDGFEVRAVTSDGRFVSFAKGPDALDKTIVDAMISEGLGDAGLYKKAGQSVIDKVGWSQYKKMASRERKKLIDSEIENIVNTWFRENSSKYGYVFTEGSI
jgi:SPP1 gp7 family putative phage head morphogenesis protein